MTSLCIPVAADGQLQVRRFAAAGPAVLMVHGLGARGDLFCPTGGGGLAPWLAEAGYDVHVPDLRERVSSSSVIPDISQHQLICEDFPALFQRLAEAHPRQRFFVVAHGWGGVLVASALIRQPHWLEQVAGLVHLGVRRVCRQRNWQRRLLLDLMWDRLAPLIGQRRGYLPLRSLGLGSADLSRQLHDDSRMWQNGGKWRDPQDGFDYAAALTGVVWPSSLYLAGRNDRCMGHVADVRAFARELGEHDAQLVLLQKGTGSSRDYGHHDLLTHPQAANDHFPLIMSWLGRHVGANTP